MKQKLITLSIFAAFSQIGAAGLAQADDLQFKKKLQLPAQTQVQSLPQAQTPAVQSPVQALPQAQTPAVQMPVAKAISLPAQSPVQALPQAQTPVSLPAQIPVQSPVNKPISLPTQVQAPVVLPAAQTPAQVLPNLQQPAQMPLPPNAAGAGSVVPPANAPAKIGVQALPEMKPTAPVITMDKNGQVKASDTNSRGAPNSVGLGNKPVNAAIKEIKITNQSWDEILKLSDDTILIGKNGDRKTVKEVKLIEGHVAVPTSQKQSSTNKIKVTKEGIIVGVKPSDVAAEETAAARNSVRADVMKGVKVGGVIGALQSCDLCVESVNGKAISKVRFTPGMMVTIDGGGFGDKPASVYLAGNFSKRPALRVDTWNNNQITAYFDQGYEGELDRDNVALVVQLADGRLISTEGSAKFIATRKEQIIQNVQAIISLVQTASDFPRGRNVYDCGNGDVCVYSDDYWVYGNNPDKNVEHSYTDKIDLTRKLNVGFEIANVDAGFNTYAGKLNGKEFYVFPTGFLGDVQVSGKKITITYPVNLAYEHFTFRANERNYSTSYYFKVKVVGPAGVDPIKR